MEFATSPFAGAIVIVGGVLSIIIAAENWGSMKMFLLLFAFISRRYSPSGRLSSNERLNVFLVSAPASRVIIPPVFLFVILAYVIAAGSKNSMLIFGCREFV